MREAGGGGEGNVFCFCCFLSLLKGTHKLTDFMCLDCSWFLYNNTVVCLLACFIYFSLFV